MLTTVNTHLLPAFDQHRFPPGHSNTSALLQLLSVLGITLSSSRTTDNVIEKEVKKFNMKNNEVISDFKLLPCYIQLKRFTHFCTDAYRCQLWDFESREMHYLNVAWRKVVRKL